jgi:PAS domain S-box-containing protein
MPSPPSLEDCQDRIAALEDNLRSAQRAEAELEERSRQLKTLLNNLPGMAYRCANTIDWIMSFASEGCLPLTGYSPEQMVGAGKPSFGDLIHPDDRLAGWHAVQQSLTTGLPFQREYRITRATGDLRWVWEQGRGVISGDGKLQELEGFITDITAHKAAEAELRRHRDHLEERVAERTQALSLANHRLNRSRETLQRVLAASPVGICLLEGETLRWVNNRLRQLFEFEADSDYQGKPARLLFASEGEYRRWAQMAQALKAHAEPHKGDFQLRTSRGTVFDGHLRLSAADSDETSGDAVMSVSDISWRKQAEQDRMEREKLQGVLEMAGAVCHEMNQPLQELFLRVADALENHPQLAADLGPIKIQASRLREITFKLMRITRYRAKEYIGGQMIIDIDSASDGA